jgi:hypothetical protein
MKHPLPNVATLPSPADLKRKFRSLAMLDAILMPDWELRFFSFNSKWRSGEMASMRDGEGSEFFFLFSSTGVVGKIYDKESGLAPNVASVLARVPNDFSSFKGEPAFSTASATCYLWQKRTEKVWSVVPENTVEIPLLAFVADEGEYYRAWASNYYETELDLEPVRAVFRQEPLTNDLIVSLYPEAEFNAVLRDSEEIGYPH